MRAGWAGVLRVGCLLAAGLVPLVSGLKTAFAGEVAGADLSAQIEQQDQRLGSGHGVIVLDRAGRIGREVTLGVGHDLAIEASVEWDATVRLMGSNQVTCRAGARIETGLPGFAFPKEPGAMLLAKGVGQIAVTGCAVHAAAQSVLLAGYPVTDLTMTGNTLDGLTLVATGNGASERLRFEKNAVTMQGSANAALLLFYATDVVATANSFTRVVHGAQWWGGDSAAPGMGLAQVTQAGKMVFTGNTCKDVSGSCVWGSMGYDIAIRNNVADGCGDVCFDTEGGLRTEFRGNTATGCRNGCAAVFFFSDQTMMAANHFRGATNGGLIFIKNASGDPGRHDHLSIEGNELVCVPKICPAVFQEAAAGIDFVGNTVMDGTWLPLGYARSVRIENNRFVYNQALPQGAAAIVAPDVIGDTALIVEWNHVSSRVAQLTGTACISARWTDFNAADRHLISGNTCEGLSGRAAFPIGLRVESAGRNGGLAGLWIYGSNDFRGAPVEHTVAAGSRETWLDVRVPAMLDEAVRLPGCSQYGGGIISPLGTRRVCMGSVFGWVSAAIAKD